MAISAANLAKFRKTFGKIKDIKDTEEKPKGIRLFSAANLANLKKNLEKVKNIKDTEEKPKGIRPFSFANIAKIKERLEQRTTKKTTPRSTDASPPGFKKGGSVKKRSKSSCK